MLAQTWSDLVKLIRVNDALRTSEVIEAERRQEDQSQQLQGHASQVEASQESQQGMLGWVKKTFIG